MNRIARFFVVGLIICVTLVCITGCSKRPLIEGDPTRVGSTVTFGRYEQDNNLENGKEPIEWQVLSAENGQALMISKYCLDVKGYDRSHLDESGFMIFSGWADSDIRAWLNGMFLNAAFTAGEQDKIIDANISTPDYNGIDGGPDTVDKVFLLSQDEAKRYFANDDARKSALTDYAVARCAWFCDWWLRSPGHSNDCVAFVNEDGYIEYGGVITNNFVVRPAFILNLNS